MEMAEHPLKRFFRGNYSRKDYLAVMNLVSDPAREDELRQLMATHWTETGDETLSDAGMDLLLSRIQHRIMTEERQTRKKFRILDTLQRVAALLFLPLLLGSLAYFYFSVPRQAMSGGFAEIECPEGVRTRFTLPDGTTGHLNSGSRLGYALDFNKNRKVTLSGEAFFQVTKNEKFPFTVHTPHLAILVTGTAFNVISYPGETTEEVILQSGNLEISNPAGTRITALQANQKLRMDLENGSCSRSEVIASQYTGWTEGKLVFRNEDMGQVALRLSRWYNADILIADRRLLDYTFYATFQDEQLDEVLKLLAITTPILYEEKERQPLADGTFPKRKITLRLNPAKLKAFK